MTSCRILVVEYEAIVAQDLRNRLQRMGYEVPAVCHTGEDALRCAGEASPDLVLTGIRLRGDMDGIALAGHLRDRWHVPVIFITAFSDTATLKRAIQAHPHAYVSKPFEDRELGVAVELALGQARLVQALRTSEQRYRRHFENIADVLVSFDGEMRVLDVSPSAERMVGYAPHEIIGKTMAELGILTAQSVKQLQLNFAAFRAGEAIYPHWYELVHKDGSHRWGELKSAPIIEEGKARLYMVVVRDVTQRLAAEQSLRESEARLQAIFANVDEYVAYYDKEGNCIDANNYDKPSPLGKTREEVIGTRLGFIDAASLESGQPVGEWYRQVMEQGGCISPKLFEGMHSDGSRRLLESGLALVRDGEEVLGAVINVRDVTARREMEQKLAEANRRLEARNRDLEVMMGALHTAQTYARGLIESTPDGMIVVDREGVIVDVNQALIGMTGKKREDYIGKPSTDAVAMTYAPAYVRRAADMLRQLQAGAMCVTREFLATTPEGRQRVLWVDAVSVPGAGDTAAMFLATIRDISDCRRLQDQLKQHSIQLEQANKELSQYAEVVSHDMCAPLRAIRLYTHQLRKDLAKMPPDGSPGLHLDTIDRAIDMGEIMAQEMLELARLGNRSLRVRRVDMGKLVRDVLAVVQPDGEVEWVMPDQWPIIEVDPVLLGQVLKNLIDNALKFNTSCPKRVRLDWARRSRNRYVFSVADNGIGIPSGSRQDIFRPMRQLAPGVYGDGVGMGLAIVKKAVARMGGAITVESQPGEGSTFTVIIPERMVNRRK
ncbi:MAG: PAS domain S-box protein [Dehalococcoidia bacterium]|nr:PAS domain S-box protein [Dehalococcoidia bacterium]